MLTLFILKSGAPNADAGVAERSFANIAAKFIRLDALKDLYQHDIETPWYGVIYDDEQADEMLQASISVFLEYSQADVLILFKRVNGTDKISRSPRLFRQKVAVRTDCLLPVSEDVKYDSVLNGWLV